MSTISTTTTSMAHNHTLGNDPDLANHICPDYCWGDGTPLDTDSLLEEDIVKLCVGM